MHRPAIERERSQIPGADAVQIAEGNTCGRASASARTAGVVEDPGMCRRSLHGNREVSRLSTPELAYILEVEGYCVFTAEDGRQGLELLHKSPRPFVVLLDLGLPILNGHEFLRNQKQDPEVADIPVFVITALFEPSVPNATAIFPKPLDLQKLKGLLSEYSNNPERGH